LVDVASDSFDFGVLFEQESWGFKSTAILVTLFMSLVFIATWLYINWLLREMLIIFLTVPTVAYGYQRQRLSYNRRFLGQLAASFTWIVQVVPVYLLIVGWILWQDKRWGLTILILLLPVIFLVAAFGRGLYARTQPMRHFFRDFTPDSATISQNFGNAWFSLGLWLLVSCGSGALLQQNQFVPETLGA